MRSALCSAGIRLLLARRFFYFSFHFKKTYDDETPNPASKKIKRRSTIQNERKCKRSEQAGAPSRHNHRACDNLLLGAFGHRIVHVEIAIRII
jgi:hypothetical protein